MLTRSSKGQGVWNYGGHLAHIQTHRSEGLGIVFQHLVPWDINEALGFRHLVHLATSCHLDNENSDRGPGP